MATTTIAPNIYRAATCFEVRVFIGGPTRYLREFFALDTPLERMQQWQRDRRLERDQHRRLDARHVTNAERGTLDADVVRMLPQIEGRASYKADRSHLRACLAVVVPRDPARPQGARCRLGELARTAVTTEHINLAIAVWRREASPRAVRTIRVECYTRPRRDGSETTLAGHERRSPIASGRVAAVKTIRHRCRVLRELFHLLEGHRAVGRGARTRWFTATGQLAVTPVDGAKIPALEKTIPIDVDIETIRRVAQNLARETQPRTPPARLRDPQAWQRRELARQREAQLTYARFVVLCTTGQRPCQVMRIDPRGDVDLEARIWIVRAAKLEPAHTITLNDDMVAAFRVFLAANAFGEYDTSKHAKQVHAAGWPAGIRPYNARHAVMIAAIRAGVPLGDVQGLAGHASAQTTRSTYAPLVLERQRVVSDQLAGRLAGVFGPQAAPAAPAAPATHATEAPKASRARLTVVPPVPGTRGRKGRS